LSFDDAGIEDTPSLSGEMRTVDARRLTDPIVSESLSINKLARQHDVNVVSQIAVTQACCPLSVQDKVEPCSYFRSAA
jgi:hypothetical protein